MATRRYKINPGESENQVVSEVGAAVNSDAVEVTIELATTAVNADGTTRGILKSEVLDALEKIQGFIITNQWPPA